MGSSTPPDGLGGPPAPLPLFKQLLLTAGTIRDVAMRGEALMKHMRAASVHEVARALDQLCAENERGEHRAMLAMHVIVVMLTDANNAMWARKVLISAKTSTLPWAARLLSGFDLPIGTAAHAELGRSWRASIERTIREVEDEFPMAGSTSSPSDETPEHADAEREIQDFLQPPAFRSGLRRTERRECPQLWFFTAADPRRAKAPRESPREHKSRS
ncbi:MAG: hypothetical protein U0165_02995 [Polyangiaceae bacterium]